jgi:predicted transcriptional regulator
MSLERIHKEILRYLFDNLPQDFSDMGKVSRKILFKSVNFKHKQMEKACKDLEVKGFVILHSGFYKNDWTSISITDEGLDFFE